MGSIVAEIADKISANAEADEIRGGTGADGGGILTLSTSELTVVDGDILGRIDFQAPLETGADALLVGASIYAEADDTFAADNNSTELVFATGASEAAAEKMRITSDGKVGIGTATPVTDLTVEGPITIKEQAAADADTAGYGQIWVDDAVKSPLMYTNDAGDDIGITTGSTLNAASLGGVLPSGVTGGSGLTALGTVASGNLSNTAIVYPTGHVIFSAFTSFNGQTQGATSNSPIYSTSTLTVPAIPAGASLLAIFSGGFGESSAGYGNDWGFDINGTAYAQLITATQTYKTAKTMQQLVVFGSSATNVVIKIISTRTGDSYQEWRLGGAAPATLSVFVSK